MTALSDRFAYGTFELAAPGRCDMSGRYPGGGSYRGGLRNHDRDAGYGWHAG
jgi:hypothetical protein